MRAHLPGEIPLLPDVAGCPRESLGRRASIVTVNVDGLGEYRVHGARRTVAIIDAIVLLAPDVILLQEVTVDMYEAVKTTLSGWHLYRWREAEHYFLVTAVKAPAGDRDATTVADFRSDTRQARHLLIVRRGLWTFVNVHAESGSGARERDARALQFQRLSRQHEHDPDRVQVLAGDFNIREGERHCFELDGAGRRLVACRERGGG